MISGGSVSEMAVHFLEKYQLMCLKITSKWELRTVVWATGCTALGAIGRADAGRDGLRVQSVHQRARWSHRNGLGAARRRSDEDRDCCSTGGDGVAHR